MERIRRQNRLKEEVELNILNYERNVPDIKKAQGSWLRAKKEHALVAERQVAPLFAIHLYVPLSSIIYSTVNTLFSYLVDIDIALIGSFAVVSPSHIYYPFHAYIDLPLDILTLPLI